MNLLKRNCQFVLESYPHGWLIFAPEGKNGIPITVVGTVLKMLSREVHSKAVMAPGIASALGAIIAIMSPDKLKIWESEITAELEAMDIPKSEKWLRGVDTGASSKCLFAHLSRTHIAADKSHPHDGDDFGRCVRMIEYLGWQDRVKDAAAISPEWKSIVNRWYQLCVLLHHGKLGVIEFPKLEDNNEK